MKRSNDHPQSNCDDIEKLLVCHTYEGLSESENLQLEEHLIECDRCRDYRDSLLELKSIVRIQEEKEPTPDPVIRDNIIRRMKELKPQETGILQKTWQSVRGAFAHPIPVYQAVFGMALILLLSTGLKHLPSSAVREVSEPRVLVGTETPLPFQLGVVDNLEVVKQQKVGWSVREDSTLVCFIVSTM
jgi:predicted anti-sigma-YlaC factor YlaD